MMLMTPKRLPPWLKRPIGSRGVLHPMKVRLREKGLHTVCEGALCPNIGECWGKKGTATFMILGDVCTRGCSFCNVRKGRPEMADPDEPRKVAEMVSLLGLRHAVVTSVARDDLPDGGASQFAETIREIRKTNPSCAVEVLTTDFGMNRDAMETVCKARPDVFNHNVETVERLTPTVRHRATYGNSLEFLRRIKEFDPSIAVKSGIMLGLGETVDEATQTMHDLRSAGCDLLTIGQYLRPTTRNKPVVEYVRPEVFREMEGLGREMGFKSVAAGPFVRSSYQAEEMLKTSSKFEVRGPKFQLRTPDRDTKGNGIREN